MTIGPDACFGEELFGQAISNIIEIKRHLSANQLFDERLMIYSTNGAAKLTVPERLYRTQPLNEEVLAAKLVQHG